MKLPKINFNKFLYPIVVVFLLLVVGFFYFNSINYFHKSQEAGEKIRVYIKEVALEKVEKEDANLVIEMLNSKSDGELDLTNVVSPFKKFEEEEEEVIE